MPPKILKLAFAMGGGVSLGSFSGAALTEAIKLALLRIAEGTADYDKVKVDVFSGASAGSLSLAVMLRALTWRTRDEEKEAQADLQRDYKDLWTKAGAELRKDLIAAQVAQNLQARAWVEQINLGQLLGGNDPAREQRLRSAPGLLDSEAVYRIARDLLLPDQTRNISWDRRLLADRCLYACTLTSLTPFTNDATATFHTSPASLPGLRDALTSRVHKDMRVFDILFERQLGADAPAVLERLAVESLKADAPLPDLPPRWFRLHNGKAVEGAAWNWSERRSWGAIAATAIASGAFPAAFAPAVLERYSWEYGWRKDRTGQAAELNRISSWPKSLKDAELEQHAFAYVDGGVFNNEPVREAYRLVSFMDQLQPPDSFLRRVLYVDPSVGPEEDHFKIAALQEFGTEKGKIWNGFAPDATVQRPTFQRLFGLLGGLVNTVMHQCSSRDADGIISTRGSFQIRKRFRERIAPLVAQINKDAAQKVRDLLREGCEEFLEDWPAQLIPPGDSTQAGELTRVLHELNFSDLPAAVDAYLESGFDDPTIEARRHDWLQAHLALYFDLVMGLDGKREDARLIAITPYQRNSAADKLMPLKLLGEPISAFTGFMSLAAREHDFQAGRYCAALFLDDAARTDVSMLPDNPAARTKSPRADTNGIPALKARYRQEVRADAALLQQRLVQVAKDGLFPLAGGLISMFGLDDLLIGSIDDIVSERFNDIENDLPRSGPAIELFILIPPGIGLEIDASAVGRGKDAQETSVFLERRLQAALVTSARFEREAGQEPGWIGGAIRDGKRLFIDVGGFTFGHWAIVELPTEKQWRTLLPFAHTCLRPVLVLDLKSQPPTKKNETISSERWEIKDAAVPLAHLLMGQA